MSDSEYSDDDDFVSPTKKARKYKAKTEDETSSSSSSSQQYPKSPFTNYHLATIASCNAENLTASTTQIRQFMVDNFPYYEIDGAISWNNFFGNVGRKTPVNKISNAHQKPTVYQLVPSGFGQMKDQIIQVTKEKKSEVLSSMKYPGRLNSYLQAVNNGVKVETQSDVISDDGSDPKMNIIDLIEEAFAGQDGLTKQGICSRIRNAHPFYSDDATYNRLFDDVKRCMQKSPFFIHDNSQKVKIAHVYRIDENLKCLPVTSRITPETPSQLRKLIEKANDLYLYGNSSGICAKFFYEGEEESVPFESVAGDDNEEDDEDDDDNTNILKRIDVRIDNSPPGRFKQYLAYMTCLDKDNCQFGPDCFKFIIGDSTKKYSSTTQSAMSHSVSNSLEEHKKFLAGMQDKKNQETTVSESEPESSLYDPRPDSPMKERPPPPLPPSEPLTNKIKLKSPRVVASCKGPLEFLLCNQAHDFGRTNCLSLWSTNIKEIRKKIKNTLRNTYPDISKAKGLSLYFTDRALQVIESLYPILGFRQEYIKKQQLIGRLLDIQQEPTPIQVIELTQEDIETLINSGGITTTEANGVLVAIKYI